MGSSGPIALNWLAVVCAAATGFIIGGLWYGPLLGKAWMHATGITQEAMAKGNKARTFGLTALLNLIAAASLAMFIGLQGDWYSGLFAGFMTGATFISTALGVIYLFEMRSLKLWLINAGYQTVNFTAMGVILGAWH